MMKIVTVTFHNTALGEKYTIATDLRKGETIGEISYGRLHRTACEVNGWMHFDVVAKWS